MNYKAIKEFITESRQLKVIVIALILYLGNPSHENNQLEQVIERGSLNVATRIGPLSYFEREGLPSGMDYNLLSEFARSLGVEINVTVFDNLDKQLASVYSRDIDMAGATLTATETRMKSYAFSEPYLEVSTLLIQHSGRSAKKNY